MTGVMTTMYLRSMGSEGVAGYNNISNQDRPTTSRVCSSWWLCRMRGAMTRHLGPWARTGGSGKKVITCAPKARSVSNS